MFNAVPFTFLGCKRVRPRLKKGAVPSKNLPQQSVVPSTSKAAEDCALCWQKRKEKDLLNHVTTVDVQTQAENFE